MRRTLVLALLLVVVLSASVFASEMKTGTLDVTVVVQPYVEVEIDKTDFVFEVAGRGSHDHEEAEVTIKSNSDIQVSVQSKGFQETRLNKYITYVIHDMEFLPGRAQRKSYNVAGVNNVYSFVFKMAYQPDEVWNEILAGEYRDIITWTVTAVDNY